MSANPRNNRCAICGHFLAQTKDGKAATHDCHGSSSRKLDATDIRLERMILHLLQVQGAGKTICPSEVARAVGGVEESRWRPLMERARMAARRLSCDGRVVITQRGLDVGGTEWRGPVRIRLP